MKKDTYLQIFRRHKNKAFSGRYLPAESVDSYLKTLPGFFGLNLEGNSVGGRPIYSVEFGRGVNRILIWSQMHGNESTCTKALLDFMEAVRKKDKTVKELLEGCHFKIIPVLNPDGAAAYTRVNANEKDINRDAVVRSQPESVVLQKAWDRFQPDFCFNMHDQRTLFAAGNTDKPATVSFLSPSVNMARDINSTRKTGMQLIAGMNARLQKMIPGQIGRYDDAFNPNCMGDFFQAKHTPTILFEAGHYPNDYRREETRKFIFVALMEAIRLLKSEEYSNFSIADYQAIPENKKIFFDVIVRNVLINNSSRDLAIQYVEKLVDSEVEFVPTIEKIGDLKAFHGHKEVDAENHKIDNIAGNELKIGFFVNELVVNDAILSIKLTKN